MNVTRVAAVWAAALVLVGGLCAASGCGGQAHGRAGGNPLAERVWREDFLLAARALRHTEASVAIEVAAAKSAWPLIVDGLPARALPTTLAHVAEAQARARAVAMPALFTEERSRELTGPGAGIAGQFRFFAELAGRGWTMTRAAIETTERGPPTAAGFARANVALYIESLYDAHFALGQIDKNLLKGYRRLGGEAAFGASFTQREVDALAGAFSPATDQLQPHAGVRLGS
jgi:hypothetical protein